jgi:hypothetical protein
MYGLAPTAKNRFSQPDEDSKLLEIIDAFEVVEGRGDSVKSTTSNVYITSGESVSVSATAGFSLAIGSDVSMTCTALSVVALTGEVVLYMPISITISVRPLKHASINAVSP